MEFETKNMKLDEVGERKSIEKNTEMREIQRGCKKI